MSSFQIGDKVVQTSDVSRYFHESYATGKVISVEANSCVVEFNRWGGSHVEIKRIPIENLMSLADAQVKKSELETDFNEVEAAVSVKLNEAAKLIKEASETAGEKDLSLPELSSATSALMDALDSAGWATSSLSC